VRGLILATVILGATGCAHRAGPLTYRYVKQEQTRILVPPGVVDAATSQRIFTFRTAAPRGAKCEVSENGVDIRSHKRELRVTVNRQPLLAASPGWLATWAGSLEMRGCLAPNEGGSLALRIAESLPIDPTAANALLQPDVLHGGYVDLGPHHRLKVVSPVFKEGSLPGASSLEATAVSGSNGTLTVDVKSSADLLGYETAWFAVEPRLDRAGVRFVGGPAELHIAGKSTEESQSRFNYFRFAPDAAYFRLFFLTRLSGADHDIAILSARTRAELDEQTANTEKCGTPAEPRCILIPKEVAVVPHISVTVNGKETAILAGSRVRDAVLAAGEKNPQHALATLAVQRFYSGALTAVDFDRSAPDILDLPLSGGEDIKLGTVHSIPSFSPASPIHD
jgi:hypothetical protein